MSDSHAGKLLCNAGTVLGMGLQVSRVLPQRGFCRASSRKRFSKPTGTTRRGG